MGGLTHGPRARLAVAVEADGDTPLTVRLGGDLDLAGVSDVSVEVQELLAREPQLLVLDLADVAFCDSSGIAVLIRLANHFGQMRVRAAAPGVRRVIEVLGLADRFGLEGA
jgi:anti-sigma B factor antagonist